MARTSDRDRRLAPPPLVDRYPIVQGQNITLTYLANVKRLATTGYRQQLVDLLSELIEEDPHTYCVAQQRVLSVAGGRFEWLPADIPADDPERADAEAIRDVVARQWERLPARAQAISSLLWGIFYGVSAAENLWTPEDPWRIERLGFIHSRRLGYPDAQSWELFVWDQGQVLGGLEGFYQPTNQGSFGLRVSDWPDKFIVHAPQLRAEYPTRDGLGRIVATYMCLKRMVVRVSAQDFERFIKPWVVAYYATAEQDKASRGAGDDDIDAADAAIKALGAGALAGVTLPDTIKLELLKAASTLSQPEFLAYLDTAISKAVLGQAFTVEAQKFGSKGTSDVGKNQALELARFDAAALADTLERDFAGAIVRVNYPGKSHLTPRCRIHVEETPDAEKVMRVAVAGAGIGMAIDMDRLAEHVGLPLIPNESGEPRRVAPVKPVDLSALDESIEPPPAPALPGAPDVENDAEDEESDDPEDDDEEPAADAAE